MKILYSGFGKYMWKTGVAECLYSPTLQSESHSEGENTFSKESVLFYISAYSYLRHIKQHKGLIEPTVKKKKTKYNY